MPSSDRAAIVLAAHGSRATEANDSTITLAARLAANLNVRAYARFLELAVPSIPSAIATAVTDGATTIIILPYFLHVGIHVRDDLAAIAAEARMAHPDVSIRLTPALGSAVAIIDILTDIASRGLALEK
jgi:sirohydrochlorin ferrochelatase